MFDVSFSELLLILFVGLLVFGPEKLPQVVRTVGMWIARARRAFHQVRTEIERESGLDELKRDMHNQSIMDSLREVQDDLRQTQQELEHLPYDIGNEINRTTASRDTVDPDTIHRDSAYNDPLHHDTVHHDSAHHDIEPAQPDNPEPSAPAATRDRPS